MIRTTWVIALSAVAMVQQASATEDKWVSLFDGKTMSGWEFLKLDPKNDSNWTVKDGALTGSGAASMLYSPKGEYKNFKVRAEIKVNDKGNSGFYFRAKKEPAFTSGYESQVNATHGDPIRTGSIYTFVHLFDTSMKPDEYYTQEIEVVDKDFRGKIVTSITVSVNGKVLFTFLDHNRTHEYGHIAFQQHDPGSKVSIRKVEIMELP
jgi:3-keto-disaccharide hydrolase